MSMLLTTANSWLRHRPHPAAQPHESNSWLSLLDALLRRSEENRQRAALRELADDPHLLSDLGLTRDEALSGGPSRPLEGE
jgi:uncharacterized protein YjiS (DUF1127 family)